MRLLHPTKGFAITEIVHSSHGARTILMANLLFQEFIDPFQPGSFVIRTEYFMRYMFAREVLSKQQSAISTVYDLGCGNGYGLNIITNGNSEFSLIGFDKETELLEEAERRNIAGIRWIRTDFDRESLDNAVKKQNLPLPDAVIAFEIIEHVEDPESLLKQIYELLPDGGLLIASVPNEQFEPKKKGKPKNKFHKHLFSTERIYELLQEAGYSDITFYGQPYPNRLYHYPKFIGKLLDTLTNTFPATFATLASLIATPQPNTQHESYSIIFVVRK